MREKQRELERKVAGQDRGRTEEQEVWGERKIERDRELQRKESERNRKV